METNKKILDKINTQRCSVTLKDVKNRKNTKIRNVLQQLMDGIVLLGSANWNLIMKRREFI